MTEDEAKTKWCPMVRWTKGGWSDDVYAAHNRYVDEKAEEKHGYNRCIASDCMMWKWYLRDEAKDGVILKPIYGVCGLTK